MEISNNALGMLSLIERPAFIACEGKITAVNSAAARYRLAEGKSLDELHPETPETSQSATLTLTVTIEGSPMPATVTKMDGFDLYVLTPEEDTLPLRTLAMASQQLRIPLASLMNALENIPNPQAARSAHQLHRAICYMSDALRYSGYRAPTLTAVNIRSFADSIMESVIAHAQDLQAEITYSGLTADIYCGVDEELLERAILNMISNSLKSGSTSIHVKLKRQRDTLHFSVTDNGKSVPDHLKSQLFNRYSREPGIYDTGYGLGLGMVIIQAAAAAHKGTVLMEHLPEGGLRLTLTIAIQDRGNEVRSPILRMDYLGGMDHVLTELSDVLPDSKY